MRLLSFVPPTPHGPPDEASASVGLLSRDGQRVVDLTAVGVEDMFVAVARVGQLERVAAHLVHAPGALAYRTAEVRVLAPLPVARTAWARPLAGAAAPAAPAAAARRTVEGRALAILGEATPSEPEYADPVELLGAGSMVRSSGPLVALEVGVACVLGGEVGSGRAARDPEEGVAGYCGVLRWAAASGGRPTTWGAALGPWLVTPDELADRRVGPAAYDLALTLAVDGAERYREASAAELQQQLAGAVSAAAGTFTLRAGDVFCAVRPVPGDARVQLPGPGDDVVLHIERLGALSVRVTPAATDSVATGE